MRINTVLDFCAGHRLRGHEGRCAQLHGHNYQAAITLRGDTLDSVGRVADFDVVNDVVWRWIDTNWDHRFLLDRDDAEVIAAVTPFCGPEGPYLMDNPTAENMAKELFEQCRPLLEKRGVELESIRIHETPKYWAEYP